MKKLFLFICLILFSISNISYAKEKKEKWQHYEYWETLTLTKLKVDIKKFGINAKAKDGYFFLYKACQNANKKEHLIKYIIEKGADTHMYMGSGYNAFSACLEHGRSREIIKLFIDRGHDPNKQISSLSPLAFSLYFLPNIDTVDYLISVGADVKEVYRYDEKITPLIYPAAKNDLKMLKFLYEKGAPVDVKGVSFPISPLVRAIKRDSDIKIIKFLLEKGANVNAFDNYMRSPLDLELAKDNKRKDIIKLLRKYGAKE